MNPLPGVASPSAAVASGSRFADLVDVASLQALMDSMSKVTGIANAIIDLDGIVIVRAG